MPSRGTCFFIFSQAIHIPLLLLLQPPFTDWVMAASTSPIIILVALAIFLGYNPQGYRGSMNPGTVFLP
ncbi:hypothetical protein ASZ90_014767 [hydrocarbon metagenome]|uniref:Uncharacterized protein n=1 Tax=hydrocarbon metagenome TaxID=938273 RepID=A0A0W8F3U9_9ZZZZ